MKNVEKQTYKIDIGDASPKKQAARKIPFAAWQEIAKQPRDAEE